MSQLKLYNQNSKFSPKNAHLLPEIVEGKEKYEMEHILDKCIRYRRAEYLVKWVGYRDEDNSWLPYWKLENSSNLVNEFEKAWKKRNGKKKVNFAGACF